MATTELISQTGSLRAALGTDLIEFESAGGVSAHGTAASVVATGAAFTGDSGSGGAKGLVPAPAAGDAAAGKVLKADGTWATPSSSGPSAVSMAMIFGS